MAAYFIVEIDVKDPELWKDYVARVPAVLHKYGGRYVVRGGKLETMEGEWRPKRVTIVEFPSVEQGKRWYDSEDYRELKDLRIRATDSRMILVEGVEG
jgi:uncharacterized protein (DUF1330 family)